MKKRGGGHRFKNINRAQRGNENRNEILINERD
jgi:hypothetical protein